MSTIQLLLQGVFCILWVYMNMSLSSELTVAQHVKRLREQREALGGARVAPAARMMLQREPPIPDYTGIKTNLQLAKYSSK